MQRSYAKKIISWMRERHADGAKEWEQMAILHDDGHFAESYAIFRDLVRRYPGILESGDVCILLAELELLANGSHHEALELLNRAQKNGFEDEDRYYYLRGMAKWEDGQQEASIRDFEKCIALKPKPVYLIALAERL